MPLHGLASDGVYPASPVTSSAVRSYRTFSPLPDHESSGGLFSVALSLRSPSLDVIQHPDPVKPGLSSDRQSLPAAIRLSAHKPADSAFFANLSNKAVCDVRTGPV